MLEKLTPKQIKLQSQIRDEWINIALHEQKFDKEECEQAVKWLYYASNLKEPRVEFVYGPKDFSDKFLDSVRASVRASVGASVRASVGASVRASVGASVRASVGASVRDSVGASVGDSVGASVGASVRASVRSSVRASVGASVGDSVGASVRDSVGASVGDSVGASVGASVRASVRSSVRDSVGASVRASVRDSVRSSVGASVSYCCLSGDAEFGAWYEYWKKIGVCQEEKADKYVGYLRSGAFYVFFFEKVAFVMVRPTSVLQNDRKQLHSLTAPALTFQDGTEIYSIDGVTFDKEWWDKIANDRMTPDEIFAIDNVEHRRIAYQHMDKAKMKSLKDFKVLDEQIDTKGNPMKVISFTVQNMDEPLKFYNCICPSTGREYFLGTDETTCVKAKNKSFGLDDCEFINEW
jgi:hypothetical protein